MDRKIDEVDDDGLTTPLIANLSLNSDADEDDVPLVRHLCWVYGVSSANQDY